MTFSQIELDSLYSPLNAIGYFYLCVMVALLSICCNFQRHYDSNACQNKIILFLVSYDIWNIFIDKDSYFIVNFLVSIQNQARLVSGTVFLFIFPSVRVL